MRASFGLTVLALGAAIAAAPVIVIAAATPVYAAAKTQTVSTKVGVALQAAHDLAEKKKFKEALDKVAEADAVPDKTPFDVLTISKFKVYLYGQLGDFTSAGDAMKAQIDTGLLSAIEAQQALRDAALLYYKGQAGAKLAAAVRDYTAKYGNDAELLLLMADQSFADKDYAGAAEAAEKATREAIAKGQKPDEDGMKIWVVSAHSLNNAAGYSAALDTLIQYYPKPEYWHDVLADVSHRPGYSDKNKMDLYVLKLTAGGLRTNEEYVAMAQAALTANLPAYAQKALETGTAAKAVTDSAGNKALLATATHRAATEKLTPADEADARSQATGESLSRLATVAESYGNHAHAVELYKAALAKGGLSATDDVRLRLGVAQINGGDAATGKATLASVKGKGVADLAKFWLIYSAQTP